MKPEQAPSAEAKAAVYVLYGLARLEQLDNDAAVVYFQDAIERAPGYAQAYIGLARARLAQGDIVAAEQALALAEQQASADDEADLLTWRGHARAAERRRRGR